MINSLNEYITDRMDLQFDNLCLSNLEESRRDLWFDNLCLSNPEESRRDLRFDNLCLSNPEESRRDLRFDNLCLSNPEESRRDISYYDNHESIVSGFVNYFRFVSVLSLPSTEKYYSKQCRYSINLSTKDTQIKYNFDSDKNFFETLAKNQITNIQYQTNYFYHTTGPKSALLLLAGSTNTHNQAHSIMSVLSLRFDLGIPKITNHMLIIH